jgi:hypothetical protein
LGRREAKLPPEDVGVEQREGTALLGQLDGGQVGLVAHEFADLAGHVAGGVGVVAQAQHGQGVAQAGEAEADAALGLGFGVLLLEGQWVASSTLSSMRIEVSMVLPKPAKSKRPCR